MFLLMTTVKECHRRIVFRNVIVCRYALIRGSISLFYPCNSFGFCIAVVQHAASLNILSCATLKHYVVIFLGILLDDALLGANQVATCAL